MNTIAIESSHQASNSDMGKSHEQIHQHQHNFLQPGEPLVEEVTNTNLDDNCVDLAIKKSQDLGIKTPEKWAADNAKEKHKARRTASYMDYLHKVAKNTVDGKRKKLNDSDTSPQTRDKIRRELSYIEQNKGIPIVSSLYYVGSVKDYDNKTPDEIKKIRQAKAETLRTFFNSEAYRQLHPGLTISELHYDERGDLHGQNQEVYVNKRKNGYAEYAQRAVIKKQLIERFGGGDKGKRELNRRLDLLICAHIIVDRSNNGKGKQVGDERADNLYLDWALNGNSVKSETSEKFSQKERNTRIVELGRIEDMYWLNRTAEKVFAKYNLPWKLDTNYTTDGQHKTASQYVASLNTSKQLASTNKKVSANNKLIKQQQAKIKAQQSQLANLKQQQTTINEQQNQRDEELNRRENDLNNREATIQSRESELTTLQEQVDSLTKQRKELAQRLATDKQKVDDEEKKYQKARQRRENEEKAVDELTKQKDTLTKLVGDLTKDLANLVATITDKIKNYILHELDNTSTPQRFDHVKKFYQNRANQNLYYTDDLKHATPQQLVQNELDKKTKPKNDNKTSNDDLQL